MIELTEAKRDREGSCNSCGTRDEETVIVIAAGNENHTSSIRFCPRCFAHLHELTFDLLRKRQAY